MPERNADKEAFSPLSRPSTRQDGQDMLPCGNGLVHLSICSCFLFTSALRLSISTNEELLTHSLMRLWILSGSSELRSRSACDTILSWPRSQCELSTSEEEEEEEEEEEAEE